MTEFGTVNLPIALKSVSLLNLVSLNVPVFREVFIEQRKFCQPCGTLGGGKKIILFD